MSFFARIFGSGSKQQDQPDILFGRFSDSYKQPSKYDAWDRAVQRFEDQEYMASFEDFFDFLQDEQEENVWLERDGEALRFEILQGSKKITGVADLHRVKAEGKIAKVNRMSMGFMRRLIEGNYSLQYSRYCLDDEDDISIVFDTFTLDGSPYKLYYGIKEVALAADKQDDLLIDEFDMLSPVNTGHVVQIPDAERKVKSGYIHDQINLVIDEINTGKLNAAQYPGGITYLLLAAVYKLDFLTRPEGFSMEAFERMHRTFFAADGQSSTQKNHQLIREFQKILERPREKLEQELYRTIATFGIVNPSNHERFVQIVQGELKNMDWYVQNKHESVALAIPGYIVGHALFNYSLPEPDKDLLQLYYQIMEWSYFRALGFQLSFFNPDKQTLQKGEIKDAIQDITQTHRAKYPKLAPNIKMLAFDSRVSFAKSYLLMMADLDLSKAP